MVSTDFIATLNHWAKEENVTFPLLSDHDGNTAKAYGVLMPNRRLASRVTFVIDTDGKIAEIIEGNAAMDVTGAQTACTRIRKKS
jgi:thioredoxin-dependent peroxiredoxin